MRHKSVKYYADLLSNGFLVESGTTNEYHTAESFTLAMKRRKDLQLESDDAMITLHCATTHFSLKVIAAKLRRDLNKQQASDRRNTNDTRVKQLVEANIVRPGTRCLYMTYKGVRVDVDVLSNGSLRESDAPQGPTYFSPSPLAHAVLHRMGFEGDCKESGWMTLRCAATNESLMQLMERKKAQRLRDNPGHHSRLLQRFKRAR